MIGYAYRIRDRNGGKQMVAQMSKKSKIYHRPGCRFINRIEEDSLVTFDFEDGRIEDLQPCKCCCTLKTLYMNCKENLRTVFEDLSISTEFDGEYVRVHTDWYDWRIGLKSSSQNIKLFREERNEEDQDISLIKCTDMEKSKSIGTAMRYIAYKERIAAYPVMYRKQALQIEKYAAENGIQIEFDNADLYIITDMAAWKIAYGYHFDWYKLLHCPFDEQPLTMEEAKAAHYHVQTDVPRNQSSYKHLQYIVKHDAAKKVEQIDYKKLPQRTKKQKKYYRQAESRARRKSVSRVLDLFAELEAKGELTRVSFG